MPMRNTSSSFRIEQQAAYGSVQPRATLARASKKALATANVALAHAASLKYVVLLLCSALSLGSSYCYHSPAALKNQLQQHFSSQLTKNEFEVLFVSLFIVCVCVRVLCVLECFDRMRTRVCRFPIITTRPTRPPHCRCLRRLVLLLIVRATESAVHGLLDAQYPAAFLWRPAGRQDWSTADAARSHGTRGRRSDGTCGRHVHVQFPCHAGKTSGVHCPPMSASMEEAEPLTSVIMQLGRIIFGFGGESLGVARTTFIATWFKKRELGAFKIATCGLFRVPARSLVADAVERRWVGRDCNWDDSIGDRSREQLLRSREHPQQLPESLRRRPVRHPVRAVARSGRVCGVNGGDSGPHPDRPVCAVESAGLAPEWQAYAGDDEQQCED